MEFKSSGMWKNEWMNEWFRALFGPDALRSLVEYDAISIGELLMTFRLSFLRLDVDLNFSRRYWWSLSLLRIMTPYRLANFYRRFRWCFYLYIHGLSSPRKVHRRYIFRLQTCKRRQFFASDTVLPADSNLVFRPSLAKGCEVGDQFAAHAPMSAWVVSATSDLENGTRDEFLTLWI
jgi:hypothetical protein